MKEPMASNTPSTQWVEKTDPSDEARYAGYGKLFAQMQAAKNKKLGMGRALHRKPQLGLKAQIEVLAGLPAHARYGLFANPGRYSALVRLSNGGADSAPDGKPDLRGYAIKVTGIDGPGALGGKTTSQDFLLVNHFWLPFHNVDQFVGIAMAGAKSPLALVGYLVGQHGPFKAVRELAYLAKAVGKRFSGFATEAFGSVAPIACGPYLVRVRLTAASKQINPKAKEGWAQDIGVRLRGAPLVHELQLQFFTDEARTPVEDLTCEWPEAVAPWLTVARLTVGQQDPDSPTGKALSAEIEAATFDPWVALATHRPVGDVMRARKAVYRVSQMGRGLA
jgi:hypothetical protein